jgi:hypothetical protein
MSYVIRYILLVSCPLRLDHKLQPSFGIRHVQTFPVPAKHVCCLFDTLKRRWTTVGLIAIPPSALPVSLSTMLPALQFAVAFAVNAVFVYANPVLETRQSITTLTAPQISAFKPFTFYASTAYCQPSATINWSCGGEAGIL